MARAIIYISLPTLNDGSLPPPGTLGAGPFATGGDGGRPRFLLISEVGGAGAGRGGAPGLTAGIFDGKGRTGCAGRGCFGRGGGIRDALGEDGLTAFGDGTRDGCPRDALGEGGLGGCLILGDGGGDARCGTCGDIL